MLRTASEQDVSSSVWVYGNFSRDEFFWYSIDLGEHQGSRELKRRRTDDDSLRHGPRGKFLKPILVTSKMYACTAVALDRSIYTIGGTDTCIIPHIPVPYIRCLDTTRVDEGWKEFDMKVARIGAQAADLDGKIYIFGGDQRRDDLKKPSAGVFDLVTGRVEKVPMREGYKSDLRLVGVDRVLKRIVFVPHISYDDHYTKTELSPMVFYDAEKMEWTVEHHNTLGPKILELFRCRARVVVGTTIYWFSSLQVKAYDFVNHKFYYSKKLEDLPGYPYEWEGVCSFLFHMNEDCFCIVWIGRSLYEFNTQIHCTKLRISNCASDNMLSVDVLDTETYFIAGGHFHVMGALHVLGTSN